MPGASVKIIDRTRDLRRGLDRVIRSRLRRVGEMVRGEVVKGVSTSTRAHGPSAPGEMPHADTGMLRKSIEYDVADDGLSVSIGTTLKYGRWLETGTENMAARPYLEPTAKEQADAAARILTAPISDSDLGVKQ